MIFISTGGYSSRTAYETCLELYKYGLRNFELSGGKYSKNYLYELITFQKDAKFSVHNYFPPPQEPFVLNLASLDKNIYKLSKEHILNSIELSKKLNSKYYSFHGGFLIDPKVNEIGKKVQIQKLNPRKKSLNIFIKRVNEIADFARKIGIEILLENNVISLNNYKNFKANPLLMADVHECIEVMKNTNSNVNLLIDVGHLNVSANTLQFNRDLLFKECDSWIKGYHLSDNDGKSDSNLKISKDSWFWPFINKKLDYYSLEIYNSNPSDLLKQYKLVKDKLS